MKKIFLLGVTLALVISVLIIHTQVFAQIKDVLATSTKKINCKQPARMMPFGSVMIGQDPFFSDMEREMNKVFNSFRSRAFSNSCGILPVMPAMGVTEGRADIKLSDNNLVVTLDLPGHDRKSIDVRIKDNNLIISSERKSNKSETKDKFFRQEISYGSFSRVIQLPSKVLEDKITATYKDGVLTVTAPIDKTKPVEPKGHKILVN